MATATRDKAVEALRARNGYMSSTARIRASVILQVTRFWEASPDYRDADIDRLILKLTPMVEAGQLQLAYLTSAFLAQQANLLRGVPVKPARVDRNAIVNARGVLTKELLHRPAVSMYAALAAGQTFNQAKAAGLNRLATIVGTQMQLAKTHQARTALQASGAVYFRRVLSGSENCKICIIATTQRYSTGSLSPIHNGCDCGVEELPAGEAPGKIIDQALLDSVKALKDEDGKELDRMDQITIHEHGELGPVLTWRKHEFTGAAALEL